MSTRSPDDEPDLSAFVTEAATARRKLGPAVTSWDEPLTAAEWDERFPGVLDSLSAITGAANIIMQLGRPGVGYGVVESRVHEGSVFRHPLKRARTTFSFLAIAMLGTTEEKLVYRKAVNRSHAQVYSTEASPTKYHGMDPDLQLWVAACLFWGIVDTQRKLRGELPRDALEELYRRCATLGTTLQVRADMWPADYAAFERYWDAQLDAIHIDDTVRGYLDSLVQMKMMARPVRVVGAPVLRFFTVGFLPRRFRDEMHYAFTERDQKLFELALAALGGINRRLPRVVRQAPSLVLLWDLRRRMRRGEPLV